MQNIPADQILAKFNDFFKELSLIMHNAESDGDFKKAYEDLNRWKGRAVSYLKKKVNQAEGEKLEKKRTEFFMTTGSLENLSEKIDTYRAFFMSLAEEIKDHPEEIIANKQKPKNVLTEKKEKTIKTNDNKLWYEKWWIKYLVFPLVVAYLIFRFGWSGGTNIFEKKENIKQLPTITQIPKPTSSVNSITSAEIISAIDSLPPLQRSAASANYKGIKVSWILHLESGFISVTDKNLYTLLMRNKNSDPIITCDVDLKDYPQLKIMKNDQVFTVEGEINNIIDSLSIGLKDCKLIF